jgi:hypothetical protein
VRGEGKQERAVVESFFKPNYTSRFNVGRITRPGEDLLHSRVSAYATVAFFKTGSKINKKSYEEKRHMK